MTYALDTDTFSLLIRGHSRVVAHYAEVVTAGGHEITIPAVVRMEVLRGRFEAVTKAADRSELLTAYSFLERTETQLAAYRVLPITHSAGERFDQLRSGKKSWRGNRGDLLIACIALAHDATLVTRNRKDFQNIPKLRIENWAD